MSGAEALAARRCAATAAGALRVGLVDDHGIVRTGYRRLLELEGIAVTLEAADADQAVSALGGGTRCPVDVLVLDLSLPGRSGLELLRRVVARWPDAAVLVFSMHDHPSTVAQCVRAGARGYVTKVSDPATLVDAVRRLALGGTAFSDDVAASARRPDAPAPHDRLSPRAYDVLQALLDGHGVDAIAQALRLSPKTVANLQSAIRARLGVANAVELMAYARRHGLRG